MNGIFPSELGNLVHLEVLRLNENQISGTIPDAFGNVMLKVLDLTGNKITSFPASIGSMESLEYLSFANNDLAGSIPSGIEGLTSLLEVSLGQNSLTGIVPDFSASNNLVSLRLGSNNFDNQTFPISIINLEALRDLRMNGCGLTGEIPTRMGEFFPNLLNLHLQDNYLTGAIPSSLVDILPLEDLNLHNNQLVGTIPTELTFLSVLKTMSLSNNQLSSTIPASIGGLESLQILTLENNDLTGTIPHSISVMTELEIMDLSYNKLTGKIPDGIGQMSSIRKYSILPIMDLA